MTKHLLPLLLVVACVAACVGFQVAGGVETVHQIRKDQEKNKRVKEGVAVTNKIVDTVNHLANPTAVDRTTPRPLEWYRPYNPPGSVNGRGIMEDIVSRCTAEDKKKLAKYDKEPETKIHEGSHFVTGRCTNDFGSMYWSCFYIGDGLKVELPNPKVNRQKVMSYVSSEYRRTPLYDLYFIKQAPTWNVCPLYILDEWTASVIELRYTKSVGGREHNFNMAVVFSYYADCLVRSIKETDPHYSGMRELETFVNWQKEQVAQLCAH